MQQLPLLYLACILAGYALIKTAGLAFVTGGFAAFITAVGVSAMLIFAAALLFLGLKALFGRKH